MGSRPANTPGRNIRPMKADDWVPERIEPFKFSNPVPLTGYRRRDGLGGNPLHPDLGDRAFEASLADRLQELKDACPGAIAERHFVRMPHWQGSSLPQAKDYEFVGAPERLTTTSVTIALVPNEPVRSAEMGYYYDGDVLPTLRARMREGDLYGLAGNLGYFYTKGLIDGMPWSHNTRFPRYPLAQTPSYIGFHLFRDRETGEPCGSFQGAHPAAVAVCWGGAVEILPHLEIGAYTVIIGSRPHRIDVESIDIVTPQAAVALFTPGFRADPEIQKLVEAAEATGGEDTGWQTCNPRIPLSQSEDRVHLFIANEGNGRVPVEKIVAVWEGMAPLPSFGAVLSFRRTFFESLLGSATEFRARYLGSRVRIVPRDTAPDLDAYRQIMGGFVPAVANGEHLYYGAPTPTQVIKTLSRHGATSPVAQCGREAQNFHLQIREPAGVLVQTMNKIGWVLFDGRHEMSIGANVVDVAALLKKLEDEGLFEAEIKQALFVDGGSAMKAYHVRREGAEPNLNLLNRVAAGGRNGPGADPDGLNLYTLLALRL